ncbi:MAG: hypothetical protein ACKODL_06870 [Phenylobacterium sp.]
MAKFWPFCIAANREADYSMIAAPDFLVRSGELDFFRDRRFHLTEAMDAPTTLTLRFAAERQTYTCIYRAMPSTLDGAILTDMAGRRLFHAIGALADQAGISADQGAVLYRRARQTLAGTLRQFLAGERNGGSVLPTRSRAIVAQPLGEPR